MRGKLLLVVCMIFCIGCEENDISFEQEEHLDNHVLTTVKSGMNTNSETVIIDSEFLGIGNPQDGGCSFREVTASSVRTSTSAYGPIPHEVGNGLLVRGYGTPKHDITWNALVLMASNKAKTVTSRGDVYKTDRLTSTAISLEYAFQANVTYQIELTTVMRDRIYDLRDLDLYESSTSEAFPTVYVELRDSAEIPGNDPCAEVSKVGLPGYTESYIYRKQEQFYSETHTPVSKTFIFNISPVAPKNGLIISFLPAHSVSRNPENVLENVYAMCLSRVKVIEKPFDPSFNVYYPSSRGSGEGESGQDEDSGGGRIGRGDRP